MKVLIAGCGYIGIPLGQRLAEDGHEVWGLRRNPEKLPDVLQGIAGDLTRPDTLPRLPGQLDAVVFCPAAGGRCEEDYRKLFVDGLTGLYHRVEADSPQLQRFLFTSSTGVYTQDGGIEVSETSPTCPNHFATRTILEGEQRLLDLCGNGVILRLAGLYGPGRHRLISSVREHQAVYPPGPPQYLNQIHRDDAAGALRHLLTLNQPDSVYIGADSEPAPRKEVLTWLAERMGEPLPSADPKPPKRNRGNKRCSNRRLLQSGYRMIYPTYREGYTALLKEI